MLAVTYISLGNTQLSPSPCHNPRRPQRDSPAIILGDPRGEYVGRPFGIIIATQLQAQCNILGH